MGGNTSAAWDNTAPAEILEAARLHIRAEKAKGNPKFVNRTHLDQDGCCLLEDLGGAACTGNSCAYAPDKLKIGPDYSSHKHLDNPIPGLPVAAAAKAVGARKRKPAPRKRPAGRKAKPGRRRR